MKKFIVFTSILLLSACSSIPDTLQAPENTRLVNYQDVVTKTANENSLARWGGVIVNVKNNADGSVIEIVHYPLRASGRPNLRAESIGRFKAFVDGFIDPLVFKQERVVSVLGTVGEPVSDMIQEQPYIYPSIKVSGYHLWEDIQDVDVQTISVMPFYRFGYGFGFDSGFPYFRSRHYLNYLENRRIRIRSNNKQSGQPSGVPTKNMDGSTHSGNSSSSSNNTRQVLPERNVPPPRPSLDRPKQVSERERVRNK
jgi:outer membrane lipoprotein